MKRLGLLCLVLVTLILVGCGGSNASPGATDERPHAQPDGTPAGDAAPDDLAFTVGEDSGSLDLDVVRIAMQRPASFLPSEISPAEQESVIVADLLYDGLTEADTATGHLRPGLSSTWSADAEFTEWTFTLGSSSVDAEQAQAQFEALRNGAGSAVVAASLDHVASIEARPGEQVRFELTRPDAGFAWLLSGASFSLVGEDGATTGSFTIDSEEPEALVLESRVEGGPDVELVWAESARDAYDTLTLGVVDAAVGPPDALADAEQRFGAVPAARAISRFYGINPDSAPFADARLRRAVLTAIDRSAIVADALAAPAFSLDGLVAPTSPGYQFGGCGEACRFDPYLAADLVAEAVVDNGETPVVRVAVTDAGQSITAAAMAEDLEAVGFEVVVQEYPVTELAAVIEAGEADIHALGWIAPASSIDAVVPPLFASASSSNVAGVSSPEVDELIEAAASTAGDDARWALLNEAHQAALSEQLVVPLALAKSYFVAAPQAQAIAVRADGSLDLGASE